MATRTFTDDTDIFRSRIVQEDRTNTDILTLTAMPNDTTIEIGDTVEYKDRDATLIFSGIVQEIEDEGEKKAVVWDHGAELLQRNVNEIFTSKSPEAIIEDVINDYTSLTYVSTISSGVTIAIYPANNKRAWDVVSEMAEILLANFRVDKNKNFNLDLKADTVSSKGIDTQDWTIRGPWRENKQSLVNSCTVEADRQVLDTQESLNGTGAQTDFVLAQIPIDVKVTVGGTEKTGYVDGSSTGDYQVKKKTKTIEFDTAPASGTNNVVVDYTYSIPIKPRRRDLASITSYGQHDKVYRVPYITSRDEARKYADYIIDSFANPLKTSIWINRSNTEFNNFESYVPNQLISVNDTIRNVTGNFLIKKVVRTYPGTLEIHVGDDPDDILFWEKEVQQRIKQLEEKDDNSTIINEDESVIETFDVEVDVTINRQLKRTLPDDLHYLAPFLGESSLSDGVAYYNLDANANDSAGTNDGTVNGATLDTTDKAVGAGSYAFAGSPQRINIPDSDDFDFEQTNLFTISFWAKTSNDAAGTGLHVVSHGDSGDYSWGCQIKASAANFFIWTPAGAALAQCSGSWTADTGWHFYVWRINMTAGTTEMYRDNVLEGSTSGTLTSYVSGSADIIIGGRADGSAYFQGNIDEVGFWQRYLSTADMTSLWNSGSGFNPYMRADMSEIGDGTQRPFRSSGDSGVLLGRC